MQPCMWPWPGCGPKTPPLPVRSCCRLGPTRCFDACLLMTDGDLPRALMEQLHRGLCGRVPVHGWSCEYILIISSSSMSSCG